MSARLEVVVRPRAKRVGIEGWRADGRLVVAVAAPPEDGRANEAVAALLAESLGVKVRDVAIVRGAHSRHKLIEVRGLEEGELRLRLERVLTGNGDDDDD